MILGGDPSPIEKHFCDWGSKSMCVNVEPRRLLHVFSSFAVGGPQVRFCAVANSFGRAYHHIIVALDGNFDCAGRLVEDVSWEPVAVVAAKSRGLHLGNLRTFRGMLAQIRPDQLVTYNWGSLEWALANRWRPLAPHLHFEDGFGPEENADLQLRRRVQMRRLVLGSNTRVVVPSRTLWNIATQRWALRSCAVLLIPNGIDCGKFGNSVSKAVLKQFGIAPEGLLIGTVAALRSEKNLGRLIEAFSRNADRFPASLIVAGDGEERGKLEELAKASGVGSRIYFVGAVERPEEIYGCFDIFAMSSDTEQMPMSLLEAMASGLPVAATDVGDILNIVAEENRSLIKGCRNHEGLARSLGILASDSDLRRDLGLSNRVRARTEFALSQMLVHYRKLFDGGNVSD
jgi:L-malate glycosyltransferase